MTGRLLLLAAAGLLLWPCVGAAEITGGAPPEIESVRVGFDGRYKLGHWTPVEVTVRGGSQPAAGRIELIVSDGDGVPTRVESPEPLRTRPGISTSTLLYTRFGQAESGLLVRLVVDGEVLAEKRLESGQAAGEGRIRSAMASTAQLVVTVGPSIGADSALRAARDANVEAIVMKDAAELPDRWQGYEAIDTLVISTSVPDTFRPLTEAQAEALHRWVRLGGRVVMCVGQQAPEILGPGSRLARLAPGTFARMVPLRRTTPLEAYGDASAPVELLAGDRSLEVPLLTGVEGTIEAYDGNRPSDLPLVVRAARGLGEVVFVAVDLDRPPFVDWPGRSQFVRKLLDLRVGHSADAQRESVGAVATLGYIDLVGQLRSALDQFEGVRLVPFWAVATLIVVYIALIGPIDYWLVRKVLRRTEATWVTFPLWVVLMCVLAYVSAVWLKGTELRTNQAELVDVDLETGLVRGSIWANVFSPETGSYDLSLRVKLPGPLQPEAEPEVLFSWMGLPGTGLGGMDAAATNPLRFEDPYDYSRSLNALDDMPISIWSSKAVTARWHCRAKVPLEASLTEEPDRMLAGSITNRLGFDLADARLFYDRWVYPIRQLADGRELRIREALQPLTSRTLLTRQRIVDSKDVTTVYDPQSTDVARILEMMMFHDIAGGPDYTADLTNRYSQYCDLSGHLTAGRAVLVARVPHGGSELVVDGRPVTGPHDEEWVFYRFVLPVERGEGARAP